MLTGTVKLEIALGRYCITWLTLSAMLKNILQFFKTKKIKKKREVYKEDIAQSLLTNNSSITEIKDVEILKTFPLEGKLLNDIAALIKSGDVALLKDMPGSENLFEELTVIKFNDQNGQAYAAIIYDSYELWEEPIVVEVFKMLDTSV